MRQNNSTLNESNKITLKYISSLTQIDIKKISLEVSFLKDINIIHFFIFIKISLCLYISWFVLEVNFLKVINIINFFIFVKISPCLCISWFIFHLMYIQRQCFYIFGSILIYCKALLKRNIDKLI